MPEVAHAPNLENHVFSGQPGVSDSPVRAPAGAVTGMMYPLATADSPAGTVRQHLHLLDG